MGVKLEWNGGSAMVWRDDGLLSVEQLTAKRREYSTAAELLDELHATPTSGRAERKSRELYGLAEASAIAREQRRSVRYVGRDAYEIV